MDPAWFEFAVFFGDGLLGMSAFLVAVRVFLYSRVRTSTDFGKVMSFVYIAGFLAMASAEFARPLVVEAFFFAATVPAAVGQNVLQLRYWYTALAVHCIQVLFHFLWPLLHSWAKAETMIKQKGARVWFLQYMPTQNYLTIVFVAVGLACTTIELAMVALMTGPTLPDHLLANWIPFGTLCPLVAWYAVYTIILVTRLVQSARKTRYV